MTCGEPTKKMHMQCVCRLATNGWAHALHMICMAWFTQCVHMVSKLRTHGIHMVYTWSTHGLHMVYTWSTYGLNMVYTWSTYGPHMVYTWSTYGLQIVSTGCIFESEWAA